MAGGVSTVKDSGVGRGTAYTVGETASIRTRSSIGVTLPSVNEVAVAPLIWVKVLPLSVLDSPLNRRRRRAAGRRQ